MLQSNIKRSIHSKNVFIRFEVIPSRWFLTARKWRGRHLIHEISVLPDQIRLLWFDSVDIEAQNLRKHLAGAS